MHCHLVVGTCFLTAFTSATLWSGSLCVEAGEPQTEWKAGTASVVITPEELMWMAGYAARDKPAEGKIHDLNATALAVQDDQGTRLVIVTLDLISIPRELRDWMEEQVSQRYKLPPEALLVDASHTHCGPEIRPNKVYLPTNRANSAGSTSRGCG